MKSNLMSVKIFDENGQECLPIFDPIINHLVEWRTTVEAEVASTTETRANQVGLLNRIDSAMALLKWCEAHGFTTPPDVFCLPDIFPADCQAEIRLVDDGETNDRSGWRELIFPDGRPVRPLGGCLLIGNVRRG